MDPEDVLSRPADGPDLVLRYADHADGLVDVFLPPSLGRPAEPWPLVIAIHGGFWRQEFDRVHLRPMSAALSQQGMVVALPEYRRVGGQGGWPATGHDVEAALASIPTLIQACAPGRIDMASPVVVAGHSAGGHLALWAGLRAGSVRVRAIVALAPVTDLRYAKHAGLGNGAAADLMRGQHGQPGAELDPDVLRMVPGDVPITIIHGTEDRQVPVEMSRQVAADHPGANLRYVEVAGVEHFALIDPLAPVYASAVLPAFAEAAGRVS